jgi:site-specific recombinase XerD
LRDVTVHTLRHSFASRLIQAGVSIYKLQKLLGHASITQTERYAHLQPSSLDRELVALENRRLPSKVEPIRGPRK